MAPGMGSQGEVGDLADGKGDGPRVRLGVIGLGRLWETRHRPALEKLRDRFRITAIHDQVARRAEIEARQCACDAADGLRALIERDDVDALYVLSPQWYGLHAIELAVEVGKPIYCGLPVASDPPALERIAARVRERRLRFMPELARRFYPATLRLRELLATRLGRPRLILGHNRLFGFDRYGQPGPTTQIAPVSLPVDPGSYLVDWCRFVFQAEPTSVQGIGILAIPGPGDGSAVSDFETFTAEFPNGALAHVSLARHHRSAWGESHRFLPPAGFQVFAERGAAWLEMPDRIQWTDSEGIHEERLPMEPGIGEALGDQFCRLLRGEPSLAPTIDDALAMTRLVVDLHESQRTGRKVIPRPLDTPAGFPTPESSP